MISGKTSFCVRLFSNLQRLYSVNHCNILRCFIEDTDIPREQFPEAGRQIISHGGIPDFKMVF
jgi:hypothetical protein